MSKLIVHLGTGTILSNEDGVVYLDSDWFANDDEDSTIFQEGDDDEIVALAEKHGKPMSITPQEDK